MSNPLYSLMKNNFASNNELLRQFQQFRQTFKGDPREQVQQLLNSGRITQQQYNDAVQKAQMLQSMLKMK